MPHQAMGTKNSQFVNAPVPGCLSAVVRLKFLALMMNRMGSPEQPHRVAKPVLPIITEIVEDEREQPGAPVAGRQSNGSAASQDPVVDG